MTAIVTIFKDELRGKNDMIEFIHSMSHRMSMVGNVYIIVPGAGRLFELLNKLNEHKIAYGTHFNTSESGRAEHMGEI